MSSRVSVIVPVYNAERYLAECLDSVWAQAVQPLEVIAINDGSSDDSLEILKASARQHKNLIIVNQENHGQGYSRNLAVKKASGDYILFVDADDFLERDAIKLALTRTEASGADIVHFGWRAHPASHSYQPHLASYNLELFKDVSELVGADCERLLLVKAYFPVCNLYRRQFLIDKKVRFGEGYIYEDVEFLVRAANRASKIALLAKELYIVRFNQSSTTHTELASDRHSKAFLSAIAASFADLKPRLESTPGFLADYFLEKFTIYYQFRVPNRHKKFFRNSFVDQLAARELGSANDEASKFLRICLKLDVFTRRRYRLFHLLILYKTQIVPRLKRR